MTAARFPSAWAATDPKLTKPSKALKKNGKNPLDCFLRI